MASNNNIDTLLMSVVSMGFELEDCQQAIQNGKLTTEEIIEWILSGKPIATSSSSGPTLKLANSQSANTSHGMIGANPFVPQQSSTPQIDPPATQQSDHVSITEENVKSRMIVNEEQRRVKAEFEEKQRAEAQRIARQERLAKKKDKEDALRRIQEDRELAKAKRAHVEKSPDKAQSTTSVPKATPSKPTTDHSSAMIQIRLPGGRNIRHKFSKDDTLQSVLNHVRTTAKLDTTNMHLVQPFPPPRVVFSSVQMGCTLASLNLTPTASLALNPATATQQSSGSGSVMAPSVEGPVVPAAMPSSPRTDEPEYPPTGHMAVEDLQQVGDAAPQSQGQDVDAHQGQGHVLGGHGHVQAQAGVQHNWGGQGHILEEVSIDNVDQRAGENNEGNQLGQAMELGEEEEDEVQNMDLGAEAAPGIHADNVTWNYDWGGGGQSLIGPVLNENMLPHRSKDPKRLAAEAASRRFVRAADECIEVDPDQESSATSVPIDSLVAMVTRHVCARMNDPRQPIVGLQGLPADLAMKILEHLIKQRLLKPKSLNVFISCHLRSLVLDCYPYATNELIAAVRYHTYLVNLSLASCPLITDKGLQVLSGLKRLRTINLLGCKQITDKVFSLLQELKSLVTVNLEGTGITDAGVTSYAQTTPPHLHTLNLSRTSVSHGILQALPAIPNLTVLNLEATRINSLSGIERLEKLEALNVSNTGIYTDALLALNKCANLTALNISDTPNIDGDQALQYISNIKLQYLQLPSRLSTTGEGLQFIKDMPIHVLDLTNYINVADIGMQYLSQMKSLTKLRLSNTKITDEGLVYLQALSQLEELTLDRTQVTDDGVALLSVMGKLVELSLCETCLSDDTLLKGSLCGCVSLAKLNLSKTAVSDTGIQALRLNSLSVLNIDRTYVTQGVANSLIDSPNLPALQTVIYRQANPRQPMDEEM